MSLFTGWWRLVLRDLFGVVALVLFSWGALHGWVWVVWCVMGVSCGWRVAFVFAS